MLWIIIYIIQFIIEITYVLSIKRLMKISTYKKPNEIKHNFYDSIINNDIKQINYYVYIIKKYKINFITNMSIYGTHTFNIVINNIYKNIQLNEYLYLNNIHTGFFTQLYYSISEKDYQSIESYMTLIKKYNININTKDILGNTIFQRAIYLNDLKLIKFIYKNNYDINIYNINNIRENALDMAIKYNDLTIIKYLLSIGITNPNVYKTAIIYYYVSIYYKIYI
jgi:ankyrin repeat protein